MTAYFDAQSNTLRQLRKKSFYDDEVIAWRQGIANHLVCYAAYATNVPQGIKDRIYRELAEGMFIEWPQGLPGEPDPEDDAASFHMLHQALENLHGLFHALGSLGLTDRSNRYVGDAVALARERIIAMRKTGEWVCAPFDCDTEARILSAKALVAPQPPPMAGTGDVWARVLETWDGTPAGKDVAEARRAFGIEKYGTPIQADNYREHIVDCVQELGDGVVYAEADLLVLQRLLEDGPVLSGDQEYMVSLREEIEEMTALRKDIRNIFDRLVTIQHRRRKLGIVAAVGPRDSTETR